VLCLTSPLSLASLLSPQFVASEVKGKEGGEEDKEEGGKKEEREKETQVVVTIEHTDEIEIHHPPSYYAGAIGVHRVYLGMITTLASSWLFASNYIFSESIQNFKDAPSSRYLCEKIGLSCIIISTVYMTFHTIPNWEEVRDWGVGCGVRECFSLNEHSTNRFWLSPHPPPPPHPPHSLSHDR